MILPAAPLGDALMDELCRRWECGEHAETYSVTPERYAALTAEVRVRDEYMAALRREAPRFFRNAVLSFWGPFGEVRIVSVPA